MRLPLTLLTLVILLGFVVFFVYQRVAPPARKLRIDWRPAAWIPPWLIGLGVISYLGQFPSSEPKSGWAFQLALQAKQTIPFWWDMVAVAAFSLVIYYLASRLAESPEYVAQAVALADEEINLGDVTGDAAGATRAIPA